MTKKAKVTKAQKEAAARNAAHHQYKARAHISPVRRGPPSRFEFPAESTGENLAEVGLDISAGCVEVVLPSEEVLADAIVYKNVKGEVIGKDDEVACEESAGPEAGAEDDARQDITEEEAAELKAESLTLSEEDIAELKVQALETPMTFGSVDG